MAKSIKAIFTCLLFACSCTAEANLKLQHFTLTPSDGRDGGDFGTSVAIDGNTVVVGAYQSANINGVAYVFVKPAGGWGNMTQTAELTASDGGALDYFGSAVAISGNTIAVGAPGATINGNKGVGAVYVFVEPEGGWRNMTETAKLTASDGYSTAQFGSSVAITGKTVVAGNLPIVESGAAYVFVEPTGGWSNMTQTAELTPSDGTQYDEFGDSITISGHTVIVGAAEAGCSCNEGSGAAYVFVEPPTGWTNMTQTAKLTASDGAVGDVFGWSVSLSGSTAVIGQHGAAYVFVEPKGGWVNMTQTAKLTETINEGALGSSVSINGNVVLVGATGVQKLSGAAFVYLKPSSGWQNTSKYYLELGISFPYGYDMFGYAVAISGTTGVIGAPLAPTSPPCNGGQCQAGPGEAFVFTAN